MNERKNKVIETATSLKQLYRYKVTDYHLKDDVDDISNLYRVTQHMMPYKKINKLKEQLGKKYDMVMKKYNSKVQVYAYCKQLRQLIKDSKDEKTKKMFDHELRLECNKLPTINSAVILVFELLIMNTDLKHLPIQSPQVRSTTSNRMPFSFDSREGSGDE